MPTVANLAVSVTANTRKFTKGMDRSRRGLKGFSRDTKKATLVTRALSKALIMAGGALGAFVIARGIMHAAKSVEVFNQAMNSSLAIMGDVSDTMRHKMTRAAIEVAKVTRFAGDEVAKAYFFLASAGLTAEQSIAALPLVAKFAQAGMFDLAKATDLVTDAQSALGLSVKDPLRNLENMTRVADVLVKANTLANATVEQFSEALTTRAGTALKIYGKSLEEGVGVLAAFADQGIKGANAGTAFDIVLRELTLRSILNAAAFKKHNIQVWNASLGIRNLSRIVADLERALDGMSAKMKKTTLMELGFQQRSVFFTSALVGLSETIRDVEQATLDAGGTVEDVAAAQMTPLDKALQRLSASWLEMKTSMEPVIDLTADAVTGLAKLLDIVPLVGGQLFIASKEAGKFNKELARALLPAGVAALTRIQLPSPQAQIPGLEPIPPGAYGPPAPTPNFAGLLNRMMAPMRALRIFGTAMWDEWNEKLDEFNKKVSSVAGIVQGVLQRAKTPGERFREVLDAINISLAAGKITAEQYGKALRQARMELEQRLARLAPRAAAIPARARAAEFQQVSLARVAVQGVNTPGRPQIVSDPQVAITNRELQAIRRDMRILATAVGVIH